MKLTDPIAAYNADSNLDAQMAQRFLESHGVEAFAIEDHSVVGYWMLGTLPEIHKPQVWVTRADANRAGQLLAEYERLRAERNAQRLADQPQTIEAQCEDCGKTSTFAGSLNGTVQECPHCHAYLDVGEFEWPSDNDGPPGV